MDLRQSQLTHWSHQQLNELNRFNGPMPPLTPVSGDASFRRYFRCRFGNVPQDSVICVDSPPDTENNPAFVKLANCFQSQGIRVPEVLAVDYDQGFMLLSDLGDELLLPQLTASTVDDYYSQALAVLVDLMATPVPVEWLPDYDEVLLTREMNLFRDWFCETYLELTLSAEEQHLLTSVFERLTAAALAQPQVTVHRDFHSRNLMVLSDQQLGVIDFQDAVCGPVAYDLLSLLRDAYIGWSNDQVRAWVDSFAKKLRAKQQLMVSDDVFWLWFNQIGAQRHLKVAGIFSRLCFRDKKQQYLNDIPLTISYLVEEIRYLAAKDDAVFTDFDRWLRSRVIPALVAIDPAAKDRLDLVL